MGARILIVDDDPDLHALLLSSLKDMGCQADCASIGEQALALL
jgi:CheY-like chemotaxis protein